MELLLASAAINIACIFLCHEIAKRRGASPVFWGVMGALFGPFAVPFVLLSKSKPGGD